jgi:hypothetical protein
MVGMVRRGIGHALEPFVARLHQTLRHGARRSLDRVLPRQVGQRVRWLSGHRKRRQLLG